RRYGADRRVDGEDRPPAERLREQAAGEWPGRHAGADGRAPGGDRPAERRALELLADERERGREHRRAAEALERASRDERVDVRREGAGGRGQREDGGAGDEHALAPEAVRQRP